MTLPSGWRFRQSLFGKIVLQKSYRYPGMFPGDWEIRWRDADVQDLTVLFKE